MYLWDFVRWQPRVVNNRKNFERYSILHTTVSDAMSKDLKKRGFKFVGTTICYASILQARRDGPMITKHPVSDYSTMKKGAGSQGHKDTE